MRRRGAAMGLAACLAVVLSGCTAHADDDDAVRHIAAEELAQITSPHDATGMTLLEGPTLSDDGDLFVVDVTAPPGEPKVLRIDTDTGEASPVYTDDTGAYTSAQFSPADGRLYLTDIRAGSIISITEDGEDPVTVFAGEVDGTPIAPDDLAFDSEGNMYVSDTTGHDVPGGDPVGRIVRVDAASGEATVVAGALPAPNGISFDADYSGLWVSEYNANRVDYLALSDDGTSMTASHEAIHVDGGTGRVDSNAVDADGNVYQAFHGLTEIRVLSPSGQHLATVTVPNEDSALTSATNIAITPGGTGGYITVSGPSGGFVYTFEALAAGSRQSNGG